jgi:hypothetical protein
MKMAEPLIGIIGGYGAVGRAAARELNSHCGARLRIGGRHADAARTFVHDQLGGAPECLRVDADDPASLRAFCDDCAIVVNCAGPSHRIFDRIALAAFDAGADYIDAYGSDALRESLAAVPAGSHRVAIVAAGMMPGITGILPRWLARQGLDSFKGMNVYLCVRDRFTETSALDFLFSIANGNDGIPLAAWRDGAVAEGALEPLIDVNLPFFGRVTAYPHLSREMQRLATSLGVPHVSSYLVFHDDAMIGALGRARRRLERQHERAAASELVVAAELSLFGAAPYQQFLFRLDGQSKGRPVTRRLLFRALSTYDISGLVTAMAAIQVLNGRLAPGVHYADDTLDPESVVERLRRSPAVSVLELLEADGAATSPSESGAL